MIEIYAHQYTFTPVQKSNDLPKIQAITIEVVSGTRERDSFEAERLARTLIDSDCNVTHKIILVGYKQ